MTTTDKTAQSILDYKQMLRPNGTLTEDAGRLLASFGFADLQNLARLWQMRGEILEKLGAVRLPAADYIQKIEGGEYILADDLYARIRDLEAE